MVVFFFLNLSLHFFKCKCTVKKWSKILTAALRLEITAVVAAVFVLVVLAVRIGVCTGLATLLFAVCSLATPDAVENKLDLLETNDS